MYKVSKSGDLGYKKEFNFTSIIAETFRAYNKFNEKEQKKLINYSAYPFCEKIDVHLKTQNIDVIEFKDCIGEKCSFDDIETIAKNLTKMREIITKEMDIKIAVGGKISGFSGFYPGVLEEIYLALYADKPVILIYGFGGIVDKIIEFNNGKEVEELTFEFQSKVNSKLKQFLDENPKIKGKIKSKYNEFLNILNLQKEKIIILEFNNYHQIIADILKTFHKIFNQ